VRRGSESMESVEVCSPARLHLGFLDLNGALGRRFGSIGVAVEGFDTRLRSRPDVEVSAAGPASDRALAIAERVIGHFPELDGVRLELDGAAPAHVGLGSGTQLALAVGRAMAALAGREPAAERLAELTGRGRRSGIGIAVFEGGGFVIDGGHGEGTGVPPILSRLDFPAAWRFLLITDAACAGLSGRDERQAFAELPPAPAADADAICRSVLMQLLPGLVEADFAGVSRSLRLVQDRLGDYFAPYQGGRYTSERVARALQILDARGVVGIGQSSWGPTGFALLPSRDEAERVAGALRERFQGEPSLEFKVCSAVNSGARLSARTAGERRPSQVLRLNV